MTTMTHHIAEYLDIHGIAIGHVTDDLVCCTDEGGVYCLSLYTSMEDFDNQVESAWFETTDPVLAADVLTSRVPFPANA